MRKKKSKFWTVVFSFLPGAGHMYMGFMKLGISLMGLFFFIIFLASWLDFGPLTFILPVLWFYSFFDCLNKCYASDEEFMSMPDDYLFSGSRMPYLGRVLDSRGRVIVGLLLLFIGCYAIWNLFLVHILGAFLPGAVYYAIRNLTHSLPQLIVGVVIVAAGVWLIIGKKKEMDRDA